MQLEAGVKMRLGIVYMLLVGTSIAAAAQPQVRTSTHATPREQFAAERLRAAVKDLPGDNKIFLAVRQDQLLARFGAKVPQFWPGAQEAFILKRIGRVIVIAGSDPSGVLYGAEELMDRIRATHSLPAEIDYEDHPQLKIRGVAIGLQKPQLTYDHAEYDYPYTPQSFPWFYDKAEWTTYLDQLAEQRTNALFLWNGHPFTSLLRLPKYPEAQELSTAQLEQNIAMFKWLTAEADKRGIWILQGFYNIHLSHTFARAHNLPYHLSAPTPISSEYTRYAISEFIRNYPSVGIFMTLGEAMGPHYGPEWLSKTIIPGVLDGLAEEQKELGHPVPQPPIVVRAHATDIQQVLEQARPLYTNIDTMWKWNGESLTWTNIRGTVKDRFKMMIANSNDTVANIHLLSNLEPFRWGDPAFVQQVESNFVRIGIGGVHVYPLRYWDWPVSADKTNPQLQQTDRDWIWFASWARYAWNPERDTAREKIYWTDQFARRFTIEGELNAQAHSPRTVGLESVADVEQETQSLTAAQRAAGADLLAAYNLSGQAAPEVIRRIGITEGNREVLSLGMTMPQLIDAARFNPAQTLWTSDAPDGEELNEWVANQQHGTAHHGENPFTVTEDAAAKTAEAVKQAEAAAPEIAADARPEYDRVVNDMRCLAELMQFYKEKVRAAALVMQYGYDHNIADLTAARAPLAASVDDFAKLTSLADSGYRNAAGMETSQRQIPVRGGPQTNHWSDLLPVYQKELAVFDHRLARLQSGHVETTPVDHEKPLPEVHFSLQSGGGQVFTVEKGAALTTDGPAIIAALAPELNGLHGIRVSVRQEQPITFHLDKPAQILVGFFKSNSSKAMNVSPATEQWNILFPDAVVPVKGLPVSVWSKEMPAGNNDLDLGKGSYVVLGFVPVDTTITPHIVNLTGSNAPPNLDWLFEN